MAHSQYYPSKHVKESKPKAKGASFNSIAEKLRQLEALSPDKGKKEEETPKKTISPQPPSAPIPHKPPGVGYGPPKMGYEQSGAPHWMGNGANRPPHGMGYGGNGPAHGMGRNVPPHAQRPPQPFAHHPNGPPFPGPPPPEYYNGPPNGPPEYYNGPPPGMHMPPGPGMHPMPYNMPPHANMPPPHSNMPRHANMQQQHRNNRPFPRPNHSRKRPFAKNNQKNQPPSKKQRLNQAKDFDAKLKKFDGRLTEEEHEDIMELRERETPEKVARFLKKRKAKFPTRARQQELKEKQVKEEAEAKVSGKKILTIQEKLKRKRQDKQKQFKKNFARREQNLLGAIFKKEIQEEKTAIMDCITWIAENMMDKVSLKVDE